MSKFPFLPWAFEMHVKSPDHCTCINQLGSLVKPIEDVKNKKPSWNLFN